MAGRIAGLFVALGFLLTVREAKAFCRATHCLPAGVAEVCTPPRAMEPPDCTTPLFWNDRCVGFSIQKNGSTLVSPELAAELVTEAFESWMNADCGGSGPEVVVKRVADAACDRVEYNLRGGNANVFMFRDDVWPYPNAPHTYALTTLTFDIDTGEIVDADTEINTFDIPFTTSDSDVGYDLLSTLQHETGHFLGLAHSQHVDSVMYSLPDEGSTAGRLISADDTAGVCAIYPPGNGGIDSACDPAPHEFSAYCGGVSPPRAPAETGGCSISLPARRPRGTGAFVMIVAGSSAALGGRRRRRANASTKSAT
jgi:hypothetical protein